MHEKKTLKQEKRGGGGGSINASKGVEPVPLNTVVHQTKVANVCRTSSFNETSKQGEGKRTKAVNAGCNFAVGGLQHMGFSFRPARRNTHQVVKTSRKKKRKRGLSALNMKEEAEKG